MTLSSPGLLLLLQLQQETDLRRFLADPTANAATIATALSVAFFLGAAHALQPGHGKAVVAAYLVGSKGRVLDAVYLGGIVTFTHTASVFALGLVTLYAAQQFSPAVVTRWLTLISGLLVAGIGLWLLAQRLRGVEAGHHHEEVAPPAAAPAEGGVHHHPSVANAHSHSHSHSHSQSHSHSHSHSHGPGTGSLLSLGISGGLVPCPEALIVLLFAVSIHRIAFGLALLTAFSLGLAAVLIAIGIVMVYAGPAVRKAGGQSPWLEYLPVASALVVSVVGILMVIEAVRAF